MLGVVLIFVIGKYFYKLAEKYKQNKWLYAILGIVAYYASTAVFGVALFMVDMVFGLNIDWENTTGINLLGIPVGIASVYGIYYLLRRKWEKSVVVVRDEIQDIGKDLESTEPEE